MSGANRFTYSGAASALHMHAIAARRPAQAPPPAWTAVRASAPAAASLSAYGDRSAAGVDAALAQSVRTESDRSMGYPFYARGILDVTAC